MKYSIFIGLCAFVASTSADIAITPNPPTAEYPLYANATIKFNLSPWPPPCCKWNQSEGELYRHVRVELLVLPSNKDPPRKLCEIEYELGKLNDETGKCSEYDDRMYDFFPEMNDGVSFTLAKATLEDQGPVELKISYEDRTVQDFVELVVTDLPPAPDITATPGDEVNEEDEVEFRCSVSGCSPPPTGLTWTKRTHYGGVEPIDPESDDLADQWIDESWSVIRIRQVTYRDHAVLFTCVVTNTVGSTDNSLALLVKHEPHVSLLPCQQTGLAVRVIEGSEIYFTCEVSAYPEAGNSTWKKDNVEIENIGEEYRISDSDPSDAGTYTCMSENDLGKTESNCKIDIQYGARVTLDKEEITVGEGGSVQVTCSVDANPTEDSIDWYFNNDKNFKLAGVSLSLSNIQPENAGEYKCEAVNTMNPTEGNQVLFRGSKTVTVNVEYKPRWTTYALMKYAADESSTVLLQCHSNSYPTPSFIWKRSGSEITSGVSSDSFVSNLTIANVKSDQFGTYECHVSNSIGQSRFDVELQKPGKPDTAQACDLDNVGPYEATFTCINGFDGGRTISYEATTENGRNVETETELKDKTSIVMLIGLTPNTNYTIKLYARNEHGLSESALAVAVGTTDGNPVEEEGGTNVGAIVGGVFGALAIIMMIVAFLYFYRKRSKNGNSGVKYKDKKRQRLDVDYSETNPTYEDDLGYHYDYNYPKNGSKKIPQNDFEIYESDSDEDELQTIAKGQQDPWEINRDQIQFLNFIGEGSFTQVWSAYLTKHNAKGSVSVAVKIVKGTNTEEREKLLTEIELMKTMETHPNVISLLACSTKYEPVMMVMEYTSSGRLLNYLRQLRSGRTSLTLAQLTSCAAQVVNAMHYVSSLKLLHKDLAARSVLLDGDLNCKVGDFTVQSSSTPDSDESRVSLRWQAPECLFHNVHTSMSDVWSMGVLIWEIITLGSTPWPGYTGRQVADALRQGQRMPAPPACPPKWYDMMCECWRQHPTQRPSWDTLREFLDDELSLFYSRPQSAMPVTHLMANATDIMNNLPGEKC